MGVYMDADISAPLLPARSQGRDEDSARTWKAYNLLLGFLNQYLGTEGEGYIASEEEATKEHKCSGQE